jgi:hypothetical protein
MSGQSKVEDNTVAAAANARAPTTNNVPVARRRVVDVLVAAIARQLSSCANPFEFDVQTLYADQEKVKERDRAHDGTRRARAT